LTGEATKTSLSTSVVAPIIVSPISSTVSTAAPSNQP